MALPKSVIEKRIQRQLMSIESPTGFPDRRVEGKNNLGAGSEQGESREMETMSDSPSLFLGSDTSNDSCTTPTPDMRKSLDYDCSPSPSPSPRCSLDSTKPSPLASTPTAVLPVRGATSSPGELKESASPLARFGRSSSFRKILHSPDPSPSKGGPTKVSASLAFRAPSFQDENSSDSGYSSVPNDELQARKRTRFDSSEGPSGRDRKVEDWFSRFKNDPSLSPTLSNKSNSSSHDLDGFPLQTISELPRDESEISTRSGFTSLFSNPIEASNSQPQPGRRSYKSSQRTQRRTMSMNNCSSPAPPVPGFKLPGAPASQGAVTRSMARKEVENQPPVSAQAEDIRRRQMMELKDDPDMLPDGSKKYCLPAIYNGQHPELRSISSHTLAELIRGTFTMVRSFRIIDVRYNYEFVGGHISGAENWEHGEEEKFLSSFLPANTKPARGNSQQPRDILVFHCEFSSQRGPDFYNKLRTRDREINREVFPALHYPECYLLHLGYKEFYRNYPELCSGGYTAMVDHRFRMDLRTMRAKSKSWTGGTISRTGPVPRRKLAVDVE